ncbi:MAG: hypothetical protein LBB14_00215 [Puniceicoccales bacterium]|nr:hypothetical protein [Puniceicoccales bacterium]
MRGLLYVLTVGLFALVVWICWHASGKNKARPFLAKELEKFGLVAGPLPGPSQGTAPSGTAPSGKSSQKKKKGFSTPEDPFLAARRAMGNDCYNASREFDFSGAAKSESFHIAPDDQKELRKKGLIDSGEFRLPAADKTDSDLEGEKLAAKAILSEYVDIAQGGDTDPSVDRFLKIFGGRYLFADKFLLQTLRFSPVNWEITRQAEEVFLVELQKVADNVKKLVASTPKNNSPEEKQKKNVQGLMERLAANAQYLRPQFVRALSVVYPGFSDLLKVELQDGAWTTDVSIDFKEKLRHQAAFFFSTKKDSCKQILDGTCSAGVKALFDNAVSEINKGVDGITASGGDLEKNFKFIENGQARTTQQSGSLFFLWVSLDEKGKLASLTPPNSYFLQNVLRGAWLVEKDPEVVENFYEKRYPVALAGVFGKLFGMLAKANATNPPDPTATSISNTIKLLCDSLEADGSVGLFVKSEQGECRRLKEHFTGTPLPAKFSFSMVFKPMLKGQSEQFPKRRIVVKGVPEANKSFYIRGKGVGLDWKVGIPLVKNGEKDEWVYETDYGDNLQFKICKDGNATIEWQDGGNNIVPVLSGTVDEESSFDADAILFDGPMAKQP